MQQLTIYIQVKKYLTLICRVPAGLFVVMKLEKSER